MKLKAEIESGARIGITPDGPRGPLREVQPGALFLAQMTGCPIVPVAFGANRKWIFNKGWDEFIVPKPFARIGIMYGEPMYVRPQDSLEQKAKELKDALNHVLQEIDIISQGECGGEKPADVLIV
jgi:lysophospholipid acyltransferase (LPLAT)-like uncharacterized protein